MMDYRAFNQLVSGEGESCDCGGANWLAPHNTHTCSHVALHCVRQNDNQ